MSEFTWHKKEALQEQLKFFGAKKQKFISVYAKKPRIRVEVNKSIDVDRNTDANLCVFNGYLRNQGAIAMQRNNLYSLGQSQASLSGFGIAQSGLSSLLGLGQSSGYYANKAARIQIEAQERTMDIQRGFAAVGTAASVGFLDI